MKIILFVVLSLYFTSVSYGQKVEYKCISNGKSAARIKVTRAEGPLDYQKSKIYITKYEAFVGKELATSFYLYKHNGKLYVLGASSSKLNPTTDPILFSQPHQGSYSLNLNGIFEETASVLLNYTSINGESFYKYDVMSPKKQTNITELIFDKNMDINELKITASNSNCCCTKSNITIRLRQR